MLRMFQVGVCLVLLNLNFSVQAAFCNDIVEGLERLACFDRLAVCRTVSGVDARLDCYDRAVKNSKPVSPRARVLVLDPVVVKPIAVDPVVPNSTPSPQAASVPSTDKAAATDFGLPAKKPEAPDQISTRIKGVFDGFQPKQKFVLENGQVWQMRRNMGVRRFSAIENPEVTISSNLLGFYAMSISGLRLKLPVKRIK